MSAPAEEKSRKLAFKRNPNLESLLHSLNDLLACSEKASLEYYSDKQESYPIIFVMGPHRCGSTLFMQWLANSGVVAYPTNLLSRFYGAPVIGAQIQLLLTDPRFNFRNEILDFNNEISFESENGKTKGALAPNEFWYFWRRFLQFGELDWLPDEILFRDVDQRKLVAELTVLTRVFCKPFAIKAMILNYNIQFLNAIFDKALFVQIKRDPIDNVASILEARKRQLGSESEWYSFKIPEYPQLKNLDAITQSAGQVHYINKAVTHGISMVNETRKLVVSYEEFCQNPASFYDAMVKKLNANGCAIEGGYEGQRAFKITRKKVTDENIGKALKEFQKRES